MKCQILFSRKNNNNNKNISLSSAEFAHSMVIVIATCDSDTTGICANENKPIGIPCFFRGNKQYTYCQI